MCVPLRCEIRFKGYIYSLSIRKWVLLPFLLAMPEFLISGLKICGTTICLPIFYVLTTMTDDESDCLVCCAEPLTHLCALLTQEHCDGKASR